MYFEDEDKRPTFFRYKVLEDVEILQRSSLVGSKTWCSECCSCAGSVTRCLNFVQFLLLLCTSYFLAMAPWAMAMTEAAVMLLLYLLLVQPDGLKDFSYKWRYTEQDVVLFSVARSLTALGSFFLGLGRRLQLPYLMAAIMFAALGIPFVLTKAVMLKHHLLSRWGGLLLASLGFSLAHVVVALNVNLFARRRYQMGLITQDEEQPWMPLESSCLGGRSREAEEAVSVADLADENSRFIACEGLQVHYRLHQPVEEKDGSFAVVLIHGFGGGTFAWRNVDKELAARTGCSVYSFDRPGFGLTSRPLVDAGRGHLDDSNPYLLHFQARLVLQLCKLWSCQSVLLIGHSDGALVALRSAALACRARDEGGVQRPSAIPYADNRNPGDEGPLVRDTAERHSNDLPTASPAAASSQPIAAAVVDSSTDAAETSAPSSPFSQWLQLGQPSQPEELQAQLDSSATQLAGSPSACPDAVEDDRQALQPSLALGTASAVLGPDKDRFTGVSTSSTAQPALFQPQKPGIVGGLGQVQIVADGVKAAGLALLHPSLDGRVKPQIARIFSHSRVGRHILRRLLRMEIGEVSHNRAWHDRKKLTPEIIRLYKAPLRVKGWGAALVEASRVRREASEDDLAADFAAIAGVPVLLATGEHDRIAPPLLATELVKRMRGSPEYALIPGCGHLSHEEAAEELLDHLVPFVNAFVSLA